MIWAISSMHWLVVCSRPVRRLLPPIELIFPAGNEFRAFDMISTRYPGMHMMGIRWEDDAYQRKNPDDTGANAVTLIEARANFKRFGRAEAGDR